MLSSSSFSIIIIFFNEPFELKFLLGGHLATNSFGLGRLFYKSSRQLQNFRRHGMALTKRLIIFSAAKRCKPEFCSTLKNAFLSS